MPEASHQPFEAPGAAEPEGLPSLGEIARSAVEVARTDEAIQAGGLAGGALAGAGVAIFVEGMPINRGAPGSQEAAQTHAVKGTPPMVEATHLQEATIGGLTVFGLAAAAIYTSIRARRNR